jgi:hypothetical protein
MDSRLDGLAWLALVAATLAVLVDELRRGAPTEHVPAVGRNGLAR